MRVKVLQHHYDAAMAAMAARCPRTTSCLVAKAIREATGRSVVIVDGWTALAADTHGGLDEGMLYNLDDAGMHAVGRFDAGWYSRHGFEPFEIELTPARSWRGGMPADGE